jgi:hypothetical protein
MAAPNQKKAASAVAVKQKKNKAPPHAWKKGQSGNPNGRPPKGHSITDAMKAVLEGNPKTKQDFVKKILGFAMQGDMTAAKMIWNYMDGMPVQRNELTGKDGDPIKYDVKNPDALTNLIDQSGIVRPAPGDHSEEG